MRFFQLLENALSVMNVTIREWSLRTSCSLSTPKCSAWSYQQEQLCSIPCEFRHSICIILPCILRVAEIDCSPLLPPICWFSYKFSDVKGKAMGRAVTMGQEHSTTRSSSQAECRLLWWYLGWIPFLSTVVSRILLHIFEITWAAMRLASTCLLTQPLQLSLILMCTWKLKGTEICRPFHLWESSMFA